MARNMGDYARNNDGDLKISGGDFVVVESTAEHQRSLLTDNQGEYKQNPLVGVGAIKYIDDDTGSLPRVIVQQFMQDGMDMSNMQVNQAGFNDNKEKIFPNAYYK